MLNGVAYILSKTHPEKGRTKLEETKNWQWGRVMALMICSIL